MNKHIWYRLEYKRVVDSVFKYVCWIGGIIIVLAFSSLALDFGSFPERLLIGLVICGAFLLEIGVAIAATLKYVDKHEWELTKKIKGGQTK